MKLLLHTKNMSLVQEIDLPDGPTPRVGEVLAVPHLAADCQGLDTFLVLDVTWVLNSGRLVAEVTARAAVPEDQRFIELASSGWLAPLPQEP